MQSGRCLPLRSSLGTNRHASLPLKRAAAAWILLSRGSLNRPVHFPRLLQMRLQRWQRLHANSLSDGSLPLVASF
jgi:hypothetical protein